MQTVSFSRTITAPTTSETTFVVQAGIGEATGTLTFNGEGGSSIFGGTEYSSIMITEYEPES